MEDINNKEKEINELLAENIRLTKEIHEMTKSVKRYVTFQKVLSIIYLLLFIVPLILGAIYLPKFIGDYLAPYQELLNEGQAMNSLNNTQDILNQAQKLLNNNK